MRFVEALSRRVAKRAALPGAVLLLVVAFKFNGLALPFYWDEHIFIIPSHWLSEQPLVRVLPGMHPPGTFYGHPPALYLVYAAQYKLFGDTLWVPHASALLFAYLGVWFTYRLGSHLANPLTGALAAAFLFFSPLYFAQSTMVLADVPVTGLGVMTVYFGVRRRWIAYVLSGTLLVLVKETAVAIVVAVLVYSLVEQRASSGSWRAGLKYGVPLFAVGAFFAAERVTTGKFVANPFFDEAHPLFAFDLTSLHSILGIGVSRAGYVGTWLVFRQQKCLLTLLILLGFVVYGRAAWKKEFLAFGLLLFFFWSAFSLIFFSPRYLLPTLPCLCIAAAWATHLFARGSFLRQAVAGVVVVLVFISAYGADEGMYNSETNMQFADEVAVQREACRYVEDRFPEKTVLAAWPLSHELAAPYLGYVRRPVKVGALGSPCDLVLYAPGGDDNQKKIKGLVQQENLVRCETFCRGGRYVELFVAKAGPTPR